MVILVCPLCREALDQGQSGLSCPSCKRLYPTLRGIPDLRVEDDLYLANAEDWRFAKELDRDFDRLDLAGLLRRYYELSPEIPPESRESQMAHIRSAPDRASQWIEAIGEGLEADSPILDLGCGPGGFLASPSVQRRSRWGLDIAMRWLVIARKALDERGMADVRLVCGCAEALPFLDHSFGAVIGGDVIEHVHDAGMTLEETYRVLAPGGCAVLATPNRYSVGPEPHVGLLGVGYLPRQFMAPYVRFRRRGDFRAVFTRGCGEWKRILSRSPFGGGDIKIPSLPTVEFSGAKLGLARIYNRCVEAKVGAFLAKGVGPVFHLILKRTDVDPSKKLAHGPGRQQGSSHGESDDESWIQMPHFQQNPGQPHELRGERRGDQRDLDHALNR